MFDPRLHDTKLGGTSAKGAETGWYRDTTIEVNASIVIKIELVHEAALKHMTKSSFTHNGRVLFSNPHERACDD